MINSTIVSCFYIIKKSKFNLETYVYWMRNFLQINTNKVIFTNKYTFDILFNKINSQNVLFKIYELENFRVNKILNHYDWLDQFNMDYEKAIHSIELYQIWNEKCEMIRLAILDNNFKSEIFLWCDIGAFRDNNIISKYKNWPNSKKFNNKLIFLLVNNFTQNEIDDEKIIDFSRKNRIGGGIFGGTKKKFIDFIQQYYLMFEKFYNNTIFLGKDQSIMANVLIKSIEKINYNIIKSPSDNKWFYLQDFLNNDN